MIQCFAFLQSTKNIFYFYQDDTYHWCGATIITKFKLLTAAHCLKEFPVSIYRVRVGDFSLSKIFSNMFLNSCDLPNVNSMIRHIRGNNFEVKKIVKEQLFCLDLFVKNNKSSGHNFL